jgi:hypothetical protein
MFYAVPFSMRTDEPVVVRQLFGCVYDRFSSHGFIFLRNPMQAKHALSCIPRSCCDTRFSHGTVMSFSYVGAGPQLVIVRSERTNYPEGRLHNVGYRADSRTDVTLFICVIL